MDRMVYSKTLVPLVGNVIRDDGQCSPLPSDTILDSIWVLIRKVDKMSGQVAQAEADIATLVASDIAFKAAFAEIMNIIANPPSGIPLPAADFAALHSAATNIQADATAAEGIATSTATATASST